MRKVPFEPRPPWGEGEDVSGAYSIACGSCAHSALSSTISIIHGTERFAHCSTKAFMTGCPEAFTVRCAKFHAATRAGALTV